MASGGARARSGPAPEPNALRRDRKDDATWETLPAAGREGPTPEWPLKQATTRESEIWAQLWKRPQAVMWERNEQELEVALFVRNFAEAEQRGAAKGLRDLVRQGMEALGLSIPGLQRNHWKIEAGEDQQAAAEASVPIGTPARSRFTVIDGDAA